MDTHNIIHLFSKTLQIWKHVYWYLFFSHKKDIYTFNTCLLKYIFSKLLRFWKWVRTVREYIYMRVRVCVCVCEYIENNTWALVDIEFLFNCWTQEEKFHIYEPPCIIWLSYKRNSPWLTRKVDFINKWK